MKHVCITVRWLDQRYHGLLARGGQPEWPPSPFRLFQALVAGAARSGKLNAELGSAITWLEGKRPLIIAPRSCCARAQTFFVPNNDANKKWERQDRLTAKTARPTLMLGSPEVHYLWPTDDVCPHAALADASRCLSCVGWGVDMAYADCRLLIDEAVEALAGIRWFPRSNTPLREGLLRVATEGSMLDVIEAHNSVVNRLRDESLLRSFRRPQKFESVFYESSERPLGHPYAIFALRTADDEYFAYPHAKLMHIAGMTRSAAIRAVDESEPDGISDVKKWAERFVAGHRSDPTEDQERFSYIPLSSIGHKHADSMIRRVMISGPFGCDARLRHLAEQLDGVRLKPEDGSEGPILERISGDGVAWQYLKPATNWATVTPVILPGHDDHRPAKTLKLIQRALKQSGIEDSCEVTWSPLPNFSNCLASYRHDRNGNRIGYFVPTYLQSFTAVHLRVKFNYAVAGPLVIGAGRHMGFGALAGT